MTCEKRAGWKKILDFLSFPLRAVTLFEDDRWGLSSLRSERFEYCSSEVLGACLDVGCGRNNSFISRYLHGNGKGIDIYPYEGLENGNLLEDTACFPFHDQSFQTVTFIASINHVPRPDRDIELAEAFRCLKENGKIIITMGAPFAELLVHKVVAIYDRLFLTNHDMDGERGMDSEEDYYLSDREIRTRLQRAGFVEIKKKYFWTQWWLNAMFTALKPPN